ncbi:DUF4279 domain-containing protein [Evansella cellulosilytica]|uniref:DUF4279 domain-containing protein n=1 Tax=Evansella cellulosilytica (strain ATCC 21833 / DSM 2522 / FERM P-1141 / JCM 9156 / N-4) TaxID=649639 RepID=E6TS10_EVAC2|nr:DUF4279 domain-containing protein [Evansella cellulosilytica]ADU30664.1 hypothetical protein Bcell_2406 [Evansella cellulosilytica DSM 2522]
MTVKIFVSFHIESTFDPDFKYKHFDPEKVTKLLNIIPVQSQIFDPSFSGNTLEKIPKNNYTSSWIYSVKGICDEDESFDIVLQELYKETIVSLFTENNKHHIRKIMNDYDACCFLRISSFGLGDYITVTRIPTEVLKCVKDVSAKVEVLTHSKDVEYYNIYRAQKLYHK